MKKRIRFVYALITLTIIFGTIYVVAQQALRISGNDPQIQLAEDAASAINNGKLPASVVSSTKIDIEKSLAPFVEVYDGTGKPVAGNGYLENALPNAPVGMVQASQNKDYSAVTWQLHSTRIAAVSVAANKGFYVVSGRSLKEVEKRETQALLLAGFGWLVSVLVLGSYPLVNQAFKK